MVDSSTPTKVCTKCREVKPLTQFRKDPECRLGHKNRCRDCDRVYENARYHDPAIRARKLEQMRKRRDANPEKFRERGRKTYHADVEKYREGQREYRHSRSERANLAVRERTRRHKYTAATGIVPGRVDYAEILERDGYVCHICKQPIKPAVIRNLHFDHVIPASKGGTHTSDNIAVSHRGCNHVKHTKIL